ncbi:MAG: peptidylprolyl isomerase, partial [Planctomycetota bacterium]
ASPDEAAAELEALRKQYGEMSQDEESFWAFLDQVAREERDLMARMGQAREAEETAARSPADKELRARADALSSEVTRRSEERDKRLPEYNKRYSTHMAKVRGLFQKVDALFKKDPKNDAAAKLRLKILTDQGAVGEVRDEAERLYKAYPDDADVRLAWGECQMVVPSRGPGVPPRFDKAVEVLEPLAQVQKTNQEIQLLYGVAASAMDKNAEAKAALDSIAAVGSVRPSVRLMIGNPQDPSESFAVWRDSAAALAKDPEDWKARKKRVQLLYFVNADDRVVVDAPLALKGKPDDAGLKKLLVGALTRMRKWDEAKPLYDSLAAEMEKDDELRAQHAIFLHNTDKSGEAIAELAKVKDLSSVPTGLQQILRGLLAEIAKKVPDDPRLLGFRMKSAADQGAFTQIWDDIEGLWKQHPDDATLRFIFAETCMCVPVPAQDPRERRGPPIEPRRPRFEKAYELLDPLVKAEPANQDYLLLHGVAACALGKDAEAKKDLEAVASIESCRPAVRMLLGSARDPAQQFRRWLDIAAGLADKPGDADLLKKRAELLTLVEAYPLAVRDAEAALKAKPDDKMVRATLGRAFMAMNHFEKALAAFGDDAIEEAQAARVACLFFTNRLPEFKAALDKAKDRMAVLRPMGGAGQLFYQQPSKLDEMVARWSDEEKARAADAKKDDNPRVQLETDKGTIVLELFEDTAPNTVANFVWLVANGFYDGIKFHRIIPAFMAQGGDPTGTGSGGCGYDIKDELKGNTRFHWRGTLSMAKTSAPDSGNSQFFLNYVPTPHLNERHTVFGRVIEGQEVVDVLAIGDAIKKATVLRKRAHDYKPETIPAPGRTPWKPKDK